MQKWYIYILFYFQIPLSCEAWAPRNQKFYGTDEEYFTFVYLNKVWGQDEETISGPGSSITLTQKIVEQLPLLFKELNIKIIIDAGCGNFNWMKRIDFSDITYIGIDIVKDLIVSNQQKYGSFNIAFMHSNIQKDPLVKADLIICRSVIPHMLHNDIFELLRNFKKSGSTYLLASHYPRHAKNTEVIREYRLMVPCVPINLEKPPFNFPKPLCVIPENTNIFLADKCLALWRLDDLPL